ncbi:MAG: hypothetical protein KDA84_04180 [Planctomycetaceae bacterium]|nr:hypothetical protein [Planctomycetaceae bacterium]
MSQTNIQKPEQLVMLMRIITVAILMGPLLFLFVVLNNSENQQPQDPSQAYIAAGFAGLMIFVHFLIRFRPKPSSLPEEFRNENFDPLADEVFMALAPNYQVELIIKLALLEGATFFNIIAYQMERQWWTLAIVVLLLVLIAAKFPTISVIQQWIERQTLYWFE